MKRRILLGAAISSLFILACGDSGTESSDLKVSTDPTLTDFTDGKFHWNPYANFVSEDFLAVVRVAKDSLTVPKATFDALEKPVVPGETILVGTGSKGAMDRNPGFIYEVSSIETVGTDVVIRGEHVEATRTFVGPLSRATPPPNAKSGLGLKTTWEDSVTLVDIGSESEEHVIDLREKLGIPASKTTRAGEVTNVAQIVYKYWANASANYLVDVQLPGFRSCGFRGWGRCPTGFSVKQVDVSLHATAGATARLEMSTGIAWNKDWEKSIPLGEVPLNCGIPCSIRSQLVLKCGVGWAAGATFNSTDARVSGQIDIGVRKEGDDLAPYVEKAFSPQLPTINGGDIIPRNFSADNLVGPPVQFSASINGFCSIIPELEFVIGVDRYGVEANVTLTGAVDFKAEAEGHACAQYTPVAAPGFGTFSQKKFGGSFDISITPEVRASAALGFAGHGFYKDFGPVYPVGSFNVLHKEFGDSCP